MKSSASGKIIILGEHAVVHGSHAIVAPLDSKRFYAECTTSSGEGVHFVQKDYNFDRVFSDQDISNPIDGYKWAPKACVAILQEIKKKLQVDRFSNMKIVIQSNIKTGGFGGSTALVAATTKAILGFINYNITDDELFNLVYRIEDKFQGNISGVDTAAIVYGKPVVFNRRDGVVAKITPKISTKFMIITSGKVQSTTDEVIEWVQQNNSKEELNQFVTETTGSVLEFQKSLETGQYDQIPKYFQKAEKWLEDIGVVTKDTKQLISKINKLGGASKVSGAGTIGAHEGDSGAVICYAEDYKKIEEYLDREGVEYFYTEV